MLVTTAVHRVDSWVSQQGGSHQVSTDSIAPRPEGKHPNFSWRNDLTLENTNQCLLELTTIDLVLRCTLKSIVSVLQSSIGTYVLCEQLSSL